MTEKFQITGMTCSHCVARVKKAIESVENVQNADIRLNAPQATINSDESVSFEALQAAVESAGDYSITKIAAL